MPKYALAYFGEPNFQSREEGAAHQQKWMAWAGGLGEALVEPALPLKKPQMVVTNNDASEHTGTNRLSGFSILVADSLEDATEKTKGNPHLEFGTIEVAEIMEM